MRMAIDGMTPLRRIERWFAGQGWEPFAFQYEVWQSYLEGSSGLIHAPTGTGKTYAAWLGAVMDWMARQEASATDAPAPLLVLWLTPMRALATDTAAALRRPLEDLGIPWTVERRTGDTSSYQKQRQLERPPTALVTTPESLSILLSQRDAHQFFRHLQAVVVDEWHELLGNKRGVQAELGLARLRRWSPALRTWGVSATLGNLDEALAALLGVDDQGESVSGKLVQGLIPKEIVIDSLIPEQIERFPWAGHMGLKMLPQVLDAVAEARSTLIFTNTRNQTETWFQAILDARPEWAGEIALHHSSLSPETRSFVEDGLRDGSLRCVVATSSLDLGVDFSPVDRVLQVGSPKGVARLLQRAGRSGHQPGVASRVTCVPAHAFELVEVAAVRSAISRGELEGREPLDRPLDVLVQHVVTVAMGGGFRSDELLAEVRRSYAFRRLTAAEWEWVLAFAGSGGAALATYPDYRRVVPRDGTYRVANRQVAQRHRLSIGTITSDPMIQVKYLRGTSLGSINESFISRLTPGDKFVFAGRVLELIRLRDMTAYVRPARGREGAIPRWTGTTLPLSAELASAVRQKLDDAHHGVFEDPEMWAVKPILALQQKWSRIPEADELLIERVKTRDGHHVFIYPFAGKLVHQGLAALFAYRLSRLQPITFTLTANDYGLELLAAEPAPLDAALAGTGEVSPLLSPERLLEDIPASLNASEMARRQFREIARVAGLVFQGFPGQQRSARQLQASSSLFYDVFQQYDAGNLLLAQAHREVLERQLEHSRLSQTLVRLSQSRVVQEFLPRPSPLSFPLFVSRMQATLTSEKLADRIRRMTEGLEKWADRDDA
jgi:ATP-dependent helicase Lhr and Lhr-like helicase